MSNEKRVLIIDDEPDSIDIVESMLSEIEGISTLSANDGNSGLEKAEEAKPDLIILDVMMPELDGFAACKKLKSSEKNEIPIILLTGVAEHIRNTNYPLDGVLRSDAEEYLEKPVNPEEILRVVKKYLA